MKFNNWKLIKKNLLFIITFIVIIFIVLKEVIPNINN